MTKGTAKASPPRKKGGFFATWGAANKQWTKAESPLLGAAMAYYVLFALFALLLIILSTAGPWLSSEATVIGSALAADEAASELNAMLQDLNTNRLLAGAIGGLVLLFSTIGVLRILDRVFETVWDTGETQKIGFFRRVFVIGVRRLVSLVLVTIAALLLLFALLLQVVGVVMRDLLGTLSAESVAAIGAFASSFPAGSYIFDQVFQSSGIVDQVLLWLGSLFIGILLLMFLFRFLPDVRLRWGDVQSSAVITALLIGALSSVSIFYINTSGVQGYGAVGSMMALLLWLYLGSLLLFYGVAISYAKAYVSGSLVPPEPEPEPEPTDEPPPQGLAYDEVESEQGTQPAVATPAVTAGAAGVAGAAAATPPPPAEPPAEPVTPVAAEPDTPVAPDTTTPGAEQTAANYATVVLPSDGAEQTAAAEPDAPAAAESGQAETMVEPPAERGQAETMVEPPAERGQAETMVEPPAERGQAETIVEPPADDETDTTRKG